MPSIDCRIAVLLLMAVSCNDVLAARLGESVDDPYWTRKYDQYFQKYTKHYFGPKFDWAWFKAQAIVESGLTEAAHSPSGARGLMQILPSTFGEIRKDNPHFNDIHAPRWNIAAGIYYDRRLYKAWQEIAEQQRLYLTFGSYNAGLGGIKRAYRDAGRPKDWSRLEPYVPRETRGYVRKIRDLKARKPALQPAARTRGVGKYYAAGRGRGTSEMEL